MSDVFDKKTRSRNMSHIRGKDTKPELIIRKALHKRGFRYRLHRKDLPGKPDIVLPKYNAVILVNGCFWHGHECHLFKWPKSHRGFWENKILQNINRDKKNKLKLEELGWRILTVWECSMKGKDRLNKEEFIESIFNWIIKLRESEEITGYPSK
ncbi:MAG: DNA mismatch endonuclease Vsr [Bacteriovoracaceae bacterium]|nr:DNA mismatch endonuclease Vsr [Bacteriovoracaceae bacterium]